MAKKSSRYAEKKALGLVPHRYDKDRKGYGTVRPLSASLAARTIGCSPRPGRHCLIAA